MAPHQPAALLVNSAPLQLCANPCHTRKGPGYIASKSSAEFWRLPPLDADSPPRLNAATLHRAPVLAWQENRVLTRAGGCGSYTRRARMNRCFAGREY